MTDDSGRLKETCSGTNNIHARNITVTWKMEITLIETPVCNTPTLWINALKAKESF